MRTYVVFQLRAPLASFGLSSGLARTSERRPTKSAVLGLVGAALGHDRSDPTGLRALVAATRLAVLELKKAVPLLDYHTVQAPLVAPEEASQVSRREQIEAIRSWRNTGHAYQNGIETRREYLQDGHWVVALETPDAGRIADALDAPAYPLYLGRKCCPLSAYCAPLVVPAENVAEAFRAWLTQRQPTEGSTKRDCYWDEDMQVGDMTPIVNHRRHDVRTHSRLNHFRLRTEVHGKFLLTAQRRGV